jgi:hypothetical protein
MMNNVLVGTWKLVAWENMSLNGEITYPFGQEPIGFITYTQDGFVSVSIMRAQRPNFSSGDLLGGSDAEKLAAVESYLSYCGTYDFDGVQAVHHVQASLFPNWVGMDQIRLVELAQDTLILRTQPMLLSGKQQTARLEWKRI